MFDVIVLGSGGAGLTAALAAAAKGASVLVLEASSRWGGSTCVSAGEVWVPANHRMLEIGVPDSLEEAMQYCEPHASEENAGLVEKFVQAAPEMACFVEENSPIVWRSMSSPDSFAERSGGRASGRHLEVSPLTIGKHERLDSEFWLSNYPAIFTNDEVFEQRLLIGGHAPEGLADERISSGMVCTGIGLIVGLMQGCLALGVELERNAQMVRLLRSKDGRVHGVVVRRGGVEEEVWASRGVVLATGGFEWNTKMQRELSDGQVTHPVSPPIHYGDGLRMAAEMGANLTQSCESWIWPALDGAEQVWPDTRIPRNDLILAERCLPHVVWVNQGGQRFVNESSHNCALALSEVSPQSNNLLNMPAWAVFDNQYRSRYPLAGSMPGEKLPGQVIEAASLSELAIAAGIDELGLLRTLDRFNEMVVQGKDTDFSRGESAYDRHYGDPSAQHPNLGGVEQSPFFAVPIRLGTVGTKGGVCIDEHARVLGTQGQALDGLWAAGNTMASIIGPCTIAPGLTLGLALTWGYIAGQDAAPN